jgi:hypothetical protein
MLWCIYIYEETLIKKKKRKKRELQTCSKDFDNLTYGLFKKPGRYRIPQNKDNYIRWRNILPEGYLIIKKKGWKGLVGHPYERGRCGIFLFYFPHCIFIFMYIFNLFQFLTTINLLMFDL